MKGKRLAIIASLIFLVPLIIWVFNPERDEKRVKNGQGLVILCAGDSITAASYPEWLQKNLNLKGVKAWIINKGVKGNTSGEYLRYMQKEEILKETNPDFILLQLGTNDLRIDGDYTPTDRFRENMDKIISQMKTYLNSKGKYPKILISTIPPVVVTIPFYFDENSIRRVEEEINPAIKQLAQKWGLVLVNNYQLFLEHPEWLPEIHPNEEGYKAMAYNWYKALSPFLEVEKER